MTKRRLLACALTGAAMSLSMFSTAASAQRVQRIVAFGDSYADDGNLFQLLGVDPVSTIIYPTGRFTGGTNYVDSLGTIYSLTPNNFAIGGALTDNTNTTVGAPGFTFERLSFLAGGGGVFPTTSPTLGSGDLVTVSIGGNDARVYANSGTVAGAPGAAAVAVTNATTNLNAIIGSGTPTISFIAGNTALLPEVAGNAPVQAVRAAYSNAFNQGMQTALAGYAANGAIVHYLDLNLLFQQVQANPAAYGFTNLGPCTPIASCLTDSNFANQFVFWVDGLHPTSKTSALFAQYIATQLQAPLTLGAPSDLGLETARQFGRTLTGRMDLAARGSGDAGFRIFVTGDYLSRDVDPDAATDEFHIRDFGVTGGAEYGFGNGLVGIAGNYSRPKAKFSNGASETRDRTWQVGGFGAVSADGLFGQAYVGYGHDGHRISREGVVEGMRASPSGRHWIAGAKAGYLVPFAGLRLGPVAAIDYARAKVNGYTESGDPTLTLNVGSVSSRALEGSLGAELRGKLGSGLGNGSIQPFGSAMLVKDFEGDGRTIQFSQTSAPAIVNSWQLEDRSRRIYGRLTAGGRVRFGTLRLDALASTTVDRRGGDDTSFQIGLSAGF
jgi:outer membrane lipase/esterase